jgi:hypothetical protein
LHELCIGEDLQRLFPGYVRIGWPFFLWSEF